MNIIRYKLEKFFINIYIFKLIFEFNLCLLKKNFIKNKNKI